jgi:2-polyprenyl-3-methyl-5-hydroxy-6-metoxy-1,4-benzoquinol methylase
MERKAIEKIAIIYDDLLFKYTTAFYCKQALLNMGYSVDYYSPEDVYNIPKVYDLYLNVDENSRYIIPAHLRPSAYWVMDTHMDYDWRLRKSKMFDFVFAAQKNGAQKLKKDGIKNVYWLPLACDPDIDKKHAVPKEYDISFVGHLGQSAKRMRYLKFLKAKFKNKRLFIGEVLPQDMAMVYSKSKIVFNISVSDDINMRVFEALSCGSLLITNDLSANGQSEIFGNKPPFVVFVSKRDLFNKIKYYLSYENEREEIAGRGRQEVLAKHTYSHRMKEMINMIEQGGVGIKYGDYEEDISVMGNIYGKVFSLIDEGKRVLDIGCATGRFSKYLVRKKNCFVTGIENDAVLAQKANRALSEVILADALQQDTYNRIKLKYDYILLMDILEHTISPELILTKIKEFLEEGGRIIITTPNIAYWAVRKDLLLGRFSYTPEGGLMDNEHVHFFTCNSIKELIVNCGYKIQYFDLLYDFPFINENRSLFRKIKKAGLSGKILNKIAKNFPNFFAYQLLFVLESYTK